MNGTTTEMGEVVIVPNGLDPAVVIEYARQMGVSAEVASNELKKLGQAMLEAQPDQTKPEDYYQNRAARRARERAERKRGRG